MSRRGNVIHCGSFSKSIAPALRVGYIVAPWAIMSRMLALKTDAGSGALEQMVLAEYCAPHFAAHVPELRPGAAGKARDLDGNAERAVRHAAEFDEPKGGHLPAGQAARTTPTAKLYQAALKERRRDQSRARLNHR